MNLKRLKIPSGEITNLPYLRKIGSFGKPIILSTGMSNFIDIENAFKVANKHLPRNKIVILYCVSAYP